MTNEQNAAIQQSSQLALKGACAASLASYRQNLIRMVPSRTQIFRAANYQAPWCDPYRSR